MSFDATTAIVFIFFLTALVIVIMLIRQKSKEHMLNTFKSSVSIDNGRLVLPEEIPIDVGIVRIKGVWRSSGKSSYYDSSVEVLNRTTISVGSIELNKICNSSFYVYVDRDNNTFIEAPGFMIKSGRFKDITVLCLDPSYIPEKVVELTVGDALENAQGKVEVSRDGLELFLTWGFRVPIQKKVIHDEKHGVYRVVDEYVSKPKARGSRLDICFQTPDSKKCISLAKSDKLGTPISKTITFKIKENLAFLHKDLLESHTYNLFKNIVATDVEPIAIGYKPSYITAKLVLDIPLARDIVKEVEL